MDLIPKFDLIPKNRRLGRGSGIRTRDPLLPKQVLYLAELCPDTTVRGCVPLCGPLVKHAVWHMCARDRILTMFQPKQWSSRQMSGGYARLNPHLPPCEDLLKRGCSTRDPGFT